MGSWGHFENRSKAALGNKKARFHCARLHLHCSHVMRLYRTNLIINNLKERTNHGIIFEQLLIMSTQLQLYTLRLTIK